MAARPKLKAAPRATVKPNRRGARSRELVLDAAERVMAEHGYEGATLARIVDAAGIPMSSVYHYFGSKTGILMAVMERGAERFFDTVPDVTERLGEPEEHLTAVTAVLRTALDEHPDFLRLLVVLAAQPPTGDEQEVLKVVRRVRKTALQRLRSQFALVFDIDIDGDEAARLARLSLAMIDGAFVAQQADRGVKLADVLDQMPRVLVALHAGA